MSSERLSAKVSELSKFTWSIADTLWTAFSKSDVRDFILPLMVLRRLDCLLETSKPDVLAVAASLTGDVNPSMRDRRLFKATGLGLKVYNISPFTFSELRNQDPTHLFENLVSYINGFPEFLQDVFIARFNLLEKMRKIAEKDKLFGVFEKICEMDLHPDRVSNLEMGYVYEDLIQKFNEEANEDAGDHYTPREVVRLIAKLLLNNDREAIQGEGIVRTFYDGTCGTGGMLSVAEEEAKEINPFMSVELYGQQLKDDSYAVCVTDMLLKGQDPTRIKLGDTLKNDMHSDKKFHFCMANPPYGSEWKDAKAIVEAEHKDKGFSGRFGAGLPRVSDGQLLFVQHFASKLREDEVGGRAGIVLNGSPLFSGGAGSGESEIRRWLLENDLLEGIIALPTDMFYNTGIATYIWILNNRKTPERQGQVRLLNASGEEFWTLMRKSLGSKRKQINDDAVNKIVNLFYSGQPSAYVKDIPFPDFGYQIVTVEQPLPGDQGDVIFKKGRPTADANLRETETISLDRSVEDYFETDIKPLNPKAWIDPTKTKIGYEIQFSRYFPTKTVTRKLSEIDSNIAELTKLLIAALGGH
jgi:type I restriction enzyme M protein